MTRSSHTTRTRMSRAFAAVACCAVLAPAGASAMIPDRHAGVSPEERGTYTATRDVGATFADMLRDKGLTTSSYYAYGVGATAADYFGGPVGPEAPLSLPLGAVEAAPAVNSWPDSRAVRPTLPSTGVEVPPVADSFDWRDAGVGIAIGTLAGLVFGAVLLLARRRDTLLRA